MEFPFSLQKILPDEINIVNAEYVASLKEKEAVTMLQQVIDRAGQLSARAQGLHVPVTSFSKLRVGDDRTYLLRETDGEPNCLVGLLKVGFRKLFLHDVRGIQHEMCPLAVLDFYIHESKQRHGHGRKLFDYMIQTENVLPQHLAIDRPSPKMQGFLSKHYDLKHIFLQPNSYAVFEGFFTDRPDYKPNSARGVPFKPNQRAGSILSNTPVRSNSAKLNGSGAQMSQQRLAATTLHSPALPAPAPFQPHSGTRAAAPRSVEEDFTMPEMAPNAYESPNMRRQDQQRLPMHLPPASPFRTPYGASRESTIASSSGQSRNPPVNYAHQGKPVYKGDDNNFRGYSNTQNGQRMHDFADEDQNVIGMPSSAANNNYRLSAVPPSGAPSALAQRNATQPNAFQPRRERSHDESSNTRPSSGSNYQLQQPFGASQFTPMRSLGKTRSVTDLSRNTEVPKTLKNDHVTQQQIDSLLDRLHEAHLTRNRPSANAGGASLPPPHPAGNQRQGGYHNARMGSTNAQQNKNTTFWSIFGVN